MKKNLKPIFLTMALVIGASFMAFKVDAKDRIEKTALNDYTLSKNGVKINTKSNAKAKNDLKENITLSEEHFNIYTLSKNKDLKDKDLSSIIKKTDEVLWFIIKDGSVDGMVVVNNRIPIKMGGQNRSIELKALYDKVKQQVNEDEDIKYLEIQGQGLLIDTINDVVYLTSSARQLFNLEQEVISCDDFLTALGEFTK